MNTKEQIIDENPEVADTDKPDDLSLEEQNGDMETNQESTIEQSDDDSLPDGSGDESQTESDPMKAAEPETLRNETDEEYMRILTSVDQHLSNLQELFTGQIVRSQNQQRMFDTVYNEMKEYKENTLLEAFHKPVISNLIQLYDNFKEVETELEGINTASDSDGSEEDNTNPFESLESWFSSLSEREQKKFVRSNKELAAILEAARRVSKDRQPQPQTDLSQFQKNLEIVRIELEEVLYRMDVTPYAEDLTKLNTAFHKTIGTIETNDPDEDKVIAEKRKTGFYWRGKVFRPEEVIIYRYKLPKEAPEDTADEKQTAAPEDTADEKQTAAPEDTVGENPTDNKGDKTNG